MNDGQENWENTTLIAPGDRPEIIETDWKMAFGALAVEITRCKMTGDFSGCDWIINALYRPPVVTRMVAK
jgi:hypothetical protein